MYCLKKLDGMMERNKIHEYSQKHIVEQLYHGIYN